MGIYGPSGAYKTSDTDYWMNRAIEEIKGTYGDSVSVEHKNKSLRKFGKSVNVDNGVRTTLTTFDSAGTVVNETFVTDNDITHIASSNSGDTQTFTLEGHTIDGSGNLTFVVQTGTLAGQTKTALTTPLARATRVYNTGTTNWAGTIYIAEDVTFTSGVPQTATGIHLVGTPTINQSQKCATSLSQYDYWIITQAYASLEKGNASTVTADVEIEHRVVSTSSKVFRPVGLEITLRSGGSQSQEVDFKPYIIIPKNSDIRMVATANTNDTSVSGHISGVLATII